MKRGISGVGAIRAGMAILWLVALVPSRVLAGGDPGFQKGMSLVAFSEDVYASPESDAALDTLVASHVGWVSVCVWWFQETASSTTIAPADWGGTPSDSSVCHVIREAHARGLSVMLKPMVDPEDGTWRAEINPASWPAWFASYRRFIGHYATLAAALGVEQFSIGCELISSSLSHGVEWAAVVDTVRSLYIGPITYAANWWGEYDLISWWHLVDLVGIDAYFPLADRDDPTVEDMAAVWDTIAVGIEAFAQGPGQGLPIVFTEIGCSSYDGAAREPWNWDYDGVVPDQQEQADYYQAFFDAIAARPWMRGVFWWSWDNSSTGDYRYGGPDYEVGFTPNGKLAQEVLRANYALGAEGNFGARETLLAVYPNPARDRVWLTIRHHSAPLRIAVYDLMGRQVEGEIGTGVSPAGVIGLVWAPPPTVSAGTYVVRIESPSRRASACVSFVR